MDLDTSGHSADSICSDDTEYLLGQNVSIREIDDDDLQIHEHAKVQSSLGRSYHVSSQHSAQKLQQINAKSLRSPSRKDLKIKTGKGQDEFQRSPSRSMDKYPSSVEPSMSKVKGKPDKKSKAPHDYVSNEVTRGYSETRQQAVRHNQDFESTSKSKKTISDSYAKHQHVQSHFQSPESQKSVHVQGHHIVTGSPKLKQELHYDSPSRLTPPTREKNNAKRKPTEPGRLPVRQHLPVDQDNWEIDSEISLDMAHGGQNPVDVESNDMESQMSEATEDLIEENVDDEDITEKLKELNLAVNYDTGTNGEYIWSQIQGWKP